MGVLSLINWLLTPAKLVIPQPLVARIPGLTTNEQIRIRKALEWCNGYLLDIGCGQNKLVKQYRQNGGVGLGVDVHDWGGQDLLVEDTSKLDFEDGEFDTVVMVACINHIPNRVDVLNETHRILKPDGRLVLTNLQPFLSLIWHKYAVWDKDQHDREMKEGEVYGLKESELISILRQTGFVVQKKETFSWMLNTRYCCRKTESNRQ